MTIQEFKDWVYNKKTPMMWKNLTDTECLFICVENDGSVSVSSYNFIKHERSGCTYASGINKTVSPNRIEEIFKWISKYIDTTEYPTEVTKEFIEGIERGFDLSKNASNPYIVDIVRIPKKLYLNENIKLKIGGRTAPIIGLNELKKKIGKYDSLYDIVDLPKISKDLNKVIFDFENLDEETYGVTKDGIPYLRCYAGGDWEIPVTFFIYWDGKSLRAYLPTKGNPFRADIKTAFGSEEENGGTWEDSVIYIVDQCTPDLKKKYTRDQLLEMNDKMDINFLERIEAQTDWCLEDFESRLKP